MDIRISTETDRVAIDTIHTAAFGEEEGPEIAALVRGLFDDPTAAPVLSLVAVEDDQLVGHILFTKSVLADTDAPLSIRLLAPLAVLPDTAA